MDPFQLQHGFNEEVGKKEQWKAGYLKRRPDLQVPIKYDFDFECGKMVVGSLVIGYGMGGFLALFMNAGENAILDNTLSHKTQSKIYFRDLSKRIHRQGKSFAIFGALIFSYQCPIETYRGKKDSINGLIGGACAGAMMAISRRASFKSVITGALGTSLFIGVFDFLMPDSFH
jgi:import inner membrane translocase subunit TIM22